MKKTANLNSKTVSHHRSKPKAQESGQFVTELQQEINKVEWPSREASIKAFVTILVIVVGFTSFVAFSDALLAKLILFLKGL